MSEKHIARPEHHETHEADGQEHVERLAKHTAEQAARAKHEKSTENLAKIREMAKAEAESAQKIQTNEISDNEADSPIGMQHSLKSEAYDRMLAKIRQHLSGPTRAFSRLAHNPVIDKVSAVGAQTVARPSGVLGGSICAFLGSVILLYYSKHYGFRYNYLFMLILFVAGFMVGSALEMLVWLVHSRKQRY